MGEAPHTASPPSLKALPISKGRQGQGGALTPALPGFKTDSGGQWGGGLAIFLNIFIGRLPPRRPHWSLALLLASGNQTRGPAGPSDLTDGAEAHTLALFLHGHGNIIIQEIQMKKKLFRVFSKPKATNSSRLQPLPGWGSSQMASSSLWSSPRGRDTSSPSAGRHSACI